MYLLIWISCIFLEKLDVQPEIIRNAVEGLVNLIVESSRHQVTVKLQHSCDSPFVALHAFFSIESCFFFWQLSDLDFRDSVLTLGFSEEHQQILEVFYKGKKQEIHDALSRLTLDLPHYQDLEWRFEVQVRLFLLLLLLFCCCCCCCHHCYCFSCC